MMIMTYDLLMFVAGCCCLSPWFGAHDDNVAGLINLFVVVLMVLLRGCGQDRIQFLEIGLLLPFRGTLEHMH